MARRRSAQRVLPYLRPRTAALGSGEVTRGFVRRLLPGLSSSIPSAWAVSWYMVASPCLVWSRSPLSRGETKGEQEGRHKAREEKEEV